MPIQQGTVRPQRGGSSRAKLAAALLGIGLMAAPGVGFADGITLKVFGGSSASTSSHRARRRTSRQKIQKEVIDGFLKAYPDVSAVEWDAQGPQGDAIQRVMTAKLADQEMDLVACSAFNTNGAYVRRKLVMPITDKIKPFQDRIDAAAARRLHGQWPGLRRADLDAVDLDDLLQCRPVQEARHSGPADL